MSNLPPTPLHCYYCFEVVVRHLNGGHHAREEDSHQALVPPFPNHAFPLFVSWNTRKPNGELQLRGCIGNFSHLELHQGLREYALISAMQDSRFDPIGKHELDELTCSVSLLTEFELAKDWQDFEIGVHGIRISFQLGSQPVTATFLPEVAVEQRWTKVETVDALLRKGGYRQRVITDAFRKTIQLTRYKSRKCRVTYQEYLEWKKSSQGNGNE